MRWDKLSPISWASITLTLTLPAVSPVTFKEAINNAFWSSLHAIVNMAWEVPGQCIKGRHAFRHIQKITWVKSLAAEPKFRTSMTLVKSPSFIHTFWLSRHQKPSARKDCNWAHLPCASKQLTWWISAPQWHMNDLTALRSLNMIRLLWQHTDRPITTAQLGFTFCQVLFRLSIESGLKYTLGALWIMLLGRALLRSNKMRS